MQLQFNELIENLATSLGIVGLVVNGGATALEIDGMAVTIAYDDAENGVVLGGAIGDPPPGGAAEFSELSLRANSELLTTGRGGVAQNDETGAYTFIRRLQLDGLDVAALGEALQDFVNRLELWRKMLVAFVPASEAAKELQDGDRPLETGFMRV